MQSKLLLAVYFFSVLFIFDLMWALLLCLSLMSLTVRKFLLALQCNVSCAWFHSSSHYCIHLSLRQWVIALWCLYVYSWRFSCFFLPSVPQSLCQAVLYMFNPHKSFLIKSVSPTHINFMLHFSELFPVCWFLSGNVAIRTECRK